MYPWYLYYTPRIVSTPSKLIASYSGEAVVVTPGPGQDRSEIGLRQKEWACHRISFQEIDVLLIRIRRGK